MFSITIMWVAAVHSHIQISELEIVMSPSHQCQQQPIRARLVQISILHFDSRGFAIYVASHHNVTSTPYYSFIGRQR